MEFFGTKIDGVQVQNRKKYTDTRGYFSVVHQGMNKVFVQENESFSHKNVLRGLHYQVFPKQAKFVSVVYGSIFDVIVDLRKDSGTFKKWFGIWLDDSKSIYVPDYCAHGFFAEADSLIRYNVTGTYNPGNEIGIAWDDPEIGIEWPKHRDLIMSEKDLQNKELKDWKEHLPICKQTNLFNESNYFC
jgi:dTDP-4-dehydrorhamnose 3,5-epimerase